MTDLEQLRADLATLEAADRIAHERGHFRTFLDELIEEAKAKIAELEAQPVDEWAEPKLNVEMWLEFTKYKNSSLQQVAQYVRHLEDRVAELDHELRCELFDGRKVRDDLKGRVAESRRLWNELQAAKQARAEQLIQEGLASPPCWVVRTVDGKFIRIGNLVQVYPDKELAHMIADPNNLIVEHWKEQK